MPAVKQSEITQIQEEVKALTAPIIPRLKVLKIIGADSFAQADSFLSRICTARKTIEIRIKKILDPLNEARNEVLSLKREMDHPLLQLEEGLRDSMRQYRLEEARIAKEEEEARLKEQRRLEAEAADKLRKEQSAKTEAMRKRLQTQRLELEAKAEEVFAAPVSTPVQVVGSGTRTERRVIITDRKALISGVVAGDVPDDVIKIDEAMLERYRKAGEGTVKTWPGIEIVDDITIVRRSGR